MGITVNTSPQQITASVGETKIDVTVSGGIGPSGLDGGGYTLPTATASVLGGVKIGSGVTITDGVISVSTDYAASSHTHALADITDAGTAAGSDVGDFAAASDFDQGVKTTDSPTFDDLTLANGLSVLWDGNSQFSVGEAGGYFRNLFINADPYPGGPGLSLDSEGITFADSTQQITAFLGTIDWADVTNQPSLFDGAYTSLTSVPSTFAPSAHKTSHATGGSDALTASDIGAAAASHAHAWSDITSGVPSTFAPSAHNQAWSTITSTPTTLAGYGITDAVASNDARLTDARTPTSHAHGNITNAGAIGSTANLPVITTTSGVLTTGSFGTAANSFCQGNDSRLTTTIARFTPDMNQPPASAYALLDTRNSILVLAFDPNTQWSAVFCGVIPQNASLANGLTVRLWWMGATATSGNVRWGVSFEKVGTDNDADSFDTVTQAHSAANGTSGIETVTSITATAIDSLAAGDRFRLKVTRIADDATNDTMTGNAQLLAAEVQVA